MDLGSISALKAKCAQIISDKKPPNQIKPGDHYGLLIDLIDTLYALTSVVKSIVDKNLLDGYTEITHGLNTQYFKYEVLWFDSGKGCYVPLNVRETRRTNTTVTVYHGEAKSGCKVVFL